MARDHDGAVSPSSAQIIDIRNGAPLTPLVDQIRSGLDKPVGVEKRLPTLLLYDKQGLQLFEKITYLDEYYLTNEEIRLLEENSDRIADRIAPRSDSIVLELGSGKVKILLDALERKAVPVSYYALDLSREELERTLAEIPLDTYRYVKCFGLWGTYDDGLEWLKLPENLKRPKTILSLGSSIGNFNRRESVEFLSQFFDALNEDDTFLLALDKCTSSSKIYHAYNDRHGVTHDFILNGLKHANELLGSHDFHIPDWQVIGEYDEVAERHHAFVSPIKDVEIAGVEIMAGERVRIEESYKFGHDHSDQLLRGAHVRAGASWTNAGGDYGLYLLQRPRVTQPTSPEEYATSPVPSLTDWQGLWTAWDTITRDMIPDEELLEKPIKLRNACIFYLGHIPTFLDIHLTRSTKGKPTEPAYYQQIFERGIDPDVDDPEQCHAHSEIPDEWPPLSDVLGFQSKVRQRVLGLYDSGATTNNNAIRRALWLGFEHEVMHLETLLYMLVQSEKTLPPPGATRPDFASLAAQAAEKVVPNQWFKIPEQDITIGIDDPDDNSGAPHHFGWDNEKPVRTSKVDSFAIQARPITNGEYADFLEATGKTNTPASWMEAKIPNGGTHLHTNGQVNGDASPPPSGQAIQFNEHHRTPTTAFAQDKFVRTVYGPVPLAQALHWPLSASYDEISDYATHAGGRVPTMEEARSVYNYVETEKRKQREAMNARHETIPAVNGHLVNDGVEETPPSPHDSARENDEDICAGDVFIDLAGTNTGFRHWHPMPVTDKGNTLAGQSDMGGLWEWTSTTLAPHEGFKPMQLYPGYTADFFDGKHNVVLGGSWATLARVAGRKSFVNWYQRNYPYVWAGARLVRDKQ